MILLLFVKTVSKEMNRAKKQILITGNGLMQQKISTTRMADIVMCAEENLKMARQSY